MLKSRFSGEDPRAAALAQLRHGGHGETPGLLEDRLGNKDTGWVGMAAYTRVQTSLTKPTASPA